MSSLPQLQERQDQASGPFRRPEGRVLATMEEDGRRRWLKPKVVHGAWWRRRAMVGTILIVLYTVIPWLRFDGLPVVQLNLLTRQFIILGTVFRPTDTLLLAVLALSIFFAIFLLTALAGRVWCGWGCPQTVYLELVYRPMERLILGTGDGSRKPKPGAMRVVLLAVAFTLVSAHLANTFVAWFVGTDAMNTIVRGSPTDHPVAFATFAVITGGMLFNFGYFREQTCSLICPYGRFQSALIDRDSIVIGYDSRRGEPRGKAARPSLTLPVLETQAGMQQAATGARGDCVDCTLCVQVCPAGIDIRDGLQLECVQCTQCMDACDGVMARLKRPLHLIGYHSTATLKGAPRSKWRARVIVYPAILTALLTWLVFLLVTRSSASIDQLRLLGSPFRVATDGIVEGTVRLSIDNRTRVPRTYTVVGAEGTQLIAPSSMTIDPFCNSEVDVVVRSDRNQFASGRRVAHLRVTDDATIDTVVPVTLLGPFELPALENK